MITVIENALSEEMCKYISLNMDLLFHTLGYPPDKITPRSTGYYGPFFLEALLVHLQPLVEKTVSKRLYPTYSYGRIYYNKSFLKRHTDRPAGEYGVSCCIEKEVDWPIFFEKKPGKVKSYEMNVGDICVYKGMEYPHWRRKYRGNKHTQVFLMYVDADGEYADQKWDKRAGLGMEGVQ